MRAVVWLMEGTWEACVDAAAGLGLTDVRLVHVLDEETEAGWEGGPLGLMGRGRRRPDDRLGRTCNPLDEAGSHLLTAAAARLGGRSGGAGSPGSGPEVLQLHGRTETVVLDACAGADLLICARDGVRTERGPHSLSKVTRYVVDHAPCAVLLVWPEEVPAGVDLPPAPRPPR
ncbi:MAG: hypothetical protein BGO38_03590 [Cellulomonas sp. 73-145]|uniref:hypothetical protein n=1 Tax=Cellulomonas sp. 73-145 TaxID=1895739 RepID=UPI000927379B|nr:hypothetical protein [Cellulomonas sp. 73-145]OJV57014.1 MAG: hypothetical protein BGO38_03590 [Cellulomonas sp. 73-145]